MYACSEDFKKLSHSSTETRLRIMGVPDGWTKTPATTMTESHSRWIPPFDYMPMESHLSLLVLGVCLDFSRLSSCFGEWRDAGFRIEIRCTFGQIFGMSHTWDVDEITFPNKQMPVDEELRVIGGSWRWFLRWNWVLIMEDELKTNWFDRAVGLQLDVVGIVLPYGRLVMGLAM